MNQSPIAPKKLQYGSQYMKTIHRRAVVVVIGIVIVIVVGAVVIIVVVIVIASILSISIDISGSISPSCRGSISLSRLNQPMPRLVRRLHQPTL